MEKPKDLQPLLKAIREKCLNCDGYEVNEVKACSVLDCALWYYRLGHHPDFRDPLMNKANFEGKHNLEAMEAIKVIRGDWVKPEASPEMRAKVEVLKPFAFKRKAATDNLPASLVASDSCGKHEKIFTNDPATVQSGDPPTERALAQANTGTEATKNAS